MSKPAWPVGLPPAKGSRRLLGDERLVRRAAEGDGRAFATIFRRYGQELYRFAMTIVRDPDDAQDVVQATMFKAMRALPGERRQIQLRPWLYRIAHNESVDLLRRRRGEIELAAEEPAHTPQPDEEAELRERLRILLADLRELPERQRETLVLRELSGLEFGEIAGALHASPAGVRQSLYEARTTLRRREADRAQEVGNREFLAGSA